MHCRNIIAILLIIPLAGCAVYHADPLIKSTDFAQKPADIEIDTSTLSIPSLKSYPFNAADGLSMTEVAILAVLNNPDLKLARNDAAVAHAQAFSAGLLPDPQFSVGQDFSMSSAPGITTAYNTGLGYDISALFKLPSTLRLARADNKKTDLTLLWQELQTISQAKLLFAKTISQDKALAIMKDYHSYLEAKRAIVMGAVTQHRMSMDTASPLLSAYLDMTSKLNDAERQSAKNHRDLNALLGLDPTVELHLTDSTLPDFNVMALPAIREALPNRRPDLLALEMGYKTQDEHYWQAILGQFPAINAGVTRARDNTGVNSQGFTLTISLPLFNRNQGAVAVEKATRQRLHDEYQIRLTKAYEDISGIAEDYTLTRGQYAESQANLRQWQNTLENAEKALSQHHIDLFTYANLRSAYVTKELENITLAESLQEQLIALQTLSAQDLQPPPEERKESLP